MNSEEDKRERKAAIIAACVTFGAALVILVLLFVLTVGNDRREMAQASIPEIQDMEEIFLEPELMPMENAGEPDATEDDTPAPEVDGTPEKAPKVEKEQNVPSKKDPDKTLAPKKEVVAQEAPSPVQATAPKKNEDDPKAAKAPTGATFGNTGSGKQTAPTYGAGGTGLGVTGQLSGRAFKGCPRESPTGSGKVTVVVSVEVNAEGRVVSAKIKSSSGSVSADDKKKCLSMARNSAWEPKAGAANEYGVITFSITHK